jgi:hypothetical protein
LAPTLSVLKKYIRHRKKVSEQQKFRVFVNNKEDFLNNNIILCKQLFNRIKLEVWKDSQIKTMNLLVEEASSLLQSRTIHLFKSSLNISNLFEVKKAR